MTEIKIIALDMDGTLLDSQKNVSERNRRALTACAEKGIWVVPATGRAGHGIAPEIKALPGVRYAIATNGGVVTDLLEGRNLKTCAISNEQTLSILRRLDEYPAMYDPYIEGWAITQPEFIEHLDRYGLSPVMQRMVHATRRTVPNIIRYVEETKKEAEKINVFFGEEHMGERERLRRELEQIEGLFVSSSLPNNLEINRKEATKGNALLWLADYLNISHSSVMAFGDGENDVSMLRAAGIGVAMGNAIDKAKEAAAYVTSSNDDDGVAAALEYFVLGQDGNGIWTS